MKENNLRKDQKNNIVKGVNFNFFRIYTFVFTKEDMLD